MLGRVSATMADFELKQTFGTIIELYRAYMPYVLQGAIFIPTDLAIPLGEKVAVTLQLPKESLPINFEGNAVWIMPKKILTESVRAGVGVQIDGPNQQEIRDQIEELIKEYLHSDQPTDTI